MLELTGAARTIALPGGASLPVLRDATMHVARGESLAILGRSGSGKSTLLGVLGLMDSLDGGSYRVEGRETTGLTERQLATIRGTTFGFVYQRFCLMSHLSARQNIEAPLLHRSVGSAERTRSVSGMLERVGLSDRASHRPDQLSGGEQQRVAIARALVTRPRVVLADEPTGSLDVETGEAVIGLLRELVVAEGVTLIVVTHDERIAGSLGRVVVLESGSASERSDS